jgi:uncharacterized membrane protein YbhN (UPF0104 family)
LIVNKKKWSSIIIAAVALGLFFCLGRKYFAELPRIMAANWLGILAMAVIHIVTSAMQGRTLQIGLAACGQPIRFREGFGLTILSSYSSLFLPRSGVGLIAIHLQRSRKFSLAKYSSVVLYNAAMFILSCGIAAMLAFAIDAALSGRSIHMGFMISLCVFVSAGFMGIAYRWRVPAWYRGYGSRFLRRFSRASARLGKQEIIWRFALIHVGMITLRALRLYIAFWALGIEVNPTGVFMASVLGDLAFIVSVTPSALGFRETAITLVAASLGTTTALALSAAMLDRLVFSLTTILVAQLIVALLIRSKGQSRAEDTSNTPLPGLSQALGSVTKTADTA